MQSKSQKEQSSQHHSWWPHEDVVVLGRKQDSALVCVIWVSCQWADRFCGARHTQQRSLNSRAVSTCSTLWSIGCCSRSQSCWFLVVFFKLTAPVGRASGISWISPSCDLQNKNVSSFFYFQTQCAYLIDHFCNLKYFVVQDFITKWIQ